MPGLWTSEGLRELHKVLDNSFDSGLLKQPRANKMIMVEAHFSSASFFCTQVPFLGAEVVTAAENLKLACSMYCNHQPGQALSREGITITHPSPTSGEDFGEEPCKQAKQKQRAS